MPDHQTEVERRIAADLRHEAASLIKVADRLDPMPTEIITMSGVLSAEAAQDLVERFQSGAPGEVHILEGGGASLTEIVTIGVSQGAVLVTQERDRQIREEGHVDDTVHTAAELAWAAACYVTRAADSNIPQDHKSIPTMWPWTDKEWKPKPDRVRNLVVAAALIVAEIDRSLAAGEPDTKETSP